MSISKRQKLKETISAGSKSPIKYMVFIDAGSYITRGNGLMTNIIGSGTAPEISKWFRKFSTSNEYKSKADQFKSLSSRFASLPTLKTMYNALNKIKSKGATAEDKTQTEKDLNLVINKIGRIISSKLTEEDKELFQSVSSYLDGISGNVVSKLDSTINPVTEPATEKPAEEKPEDKGGEKPAEKPAETPAAEKPAETPAAEKPAEKSAEKPAETPAAETPTEKPEEEKPKEEPKEEPKKESKQFFTEDAKRRIEKIVREILISKMRKSSKK